MNPVLQNALLRSYAGLQATGVLSTAPGRWAFARAYDLYKAAFEVPCLAGLKPLVPQGAAVVDVGANIGFFARRFARWVGEGGKVIALEPEPRNFAFLAHVLRTQGLAGRTQLIRAAAGAHTGIARLKVSPSHPGDHKLAPGGAGLDVSVVRLDDVLAKLDWPPVALVKVDVQGAEEYVLAGAEETVARLKPLWFVEVDDANLRAMGSSAARLLRRFARHGYSVHELTPRGPGPALDVAAAISDIGPGRYRDLLFKPC